MGRGSIYHGLETRYTMDRGVDMPSIGGQNAMSRGVNIPWVGGSIYYG